MIRRSVVGTLVSGKCACHNRSDLEVTGRAGPPFIYVDDGGVRTRCVPVLVRGERLPHRVPVRRLRVLAG